tara:strand:+ start:828 stop:1493 length:666 start_codon:yes stop_codon:yes gene_type:complete
MSRKNPIISTDLEVSVGCPTATADKGMSVIRGWRRDNYLLMDIPKFKRAFPVKSYVKDIWVVRYIFQGKVIGFSAKGKTEIPPCDLFALKYPDNVETHLLRNQSRAYLNMPIRLHTSRDPDKGDNYKGMTTDISAGGVRIKLPERIKSSDSYFLTIHLPTGKTLEYILCKIIKSSYDSRGCEFGLEFVNLKEGFKYEINLCLKQFYDGLDTDGNLLPGELK